MDILDTVAVELPCPACGEQYRISLKQILLSEQMLHEGCPVPNQFTTECPPLYYADLAECGLIQELEEVWCRLEERAATGGGKLVIQGIMNSPSPTPRRRRSKSKVQ
jgi:hypothetical protein